MLMIRFQRVGRKNDPAYRLVLIERRSKPQGAGRETLGSYHPKTKQVALKNDRILYWLSKGACASDTAHNFLVAKGIIRGRKRDVAPHSRAEQKNAQRVKAAPSGQTSVSESVPESSLPPAPEQGDAS